VKFGVIPFSPARLRADRVKANVNGAAPLERPAPDTEGNSFDA
jgi:hypothetical protein